MTPRRSSLMPRWRKSKSVTRRDSTRKRERARSPVRLRASSVCTHESLKDFTGISAPYEAPPKPEVHIKTNELSVEESVKHLISYLQEKQFI
jgi:adenylylsulfate kinase-like enzyme